MSSLTYKGKQFYKDGKEFAVIAGSIHYFRVPREYWYDRMLKLKECGFNTVETYICWNLHESNEGEFNFSGNLDFEAYVDLAKDLGLNVILRPGPYICSERDFGGLPAWLLSYKDLHIRCNDPLYLSKVKNYYDKLLPMIRPHLASNGGNVIMIQIENEYGSFGNDKEYLRAILNMYKEHDLDCLFFTSDGAYDLTLSGGYLPECFTTLNFGSRVEERSKVARNRFPDQPFMCAEFWSGWFDHWGEEHHTRDPHDFAACFKTFIDNGWSLIVYMCHGGTSFGFMNGASFGDKYAPVVTSFDFCGLLTEAGDRTETYYLIRDILVEKYGDAVPALTAQETKKVAYGNVQLTEIATLFDNLENISTAIPSVTLKYMEEVGQNYGFILYRTTVKGPQEAQCSKLSIDTVKDRAGIFVNGERRATYKRWEMPTEEEKIKIPLGVNENAQLDILVENMGRVSFGKQLKYGQKGIDGVRFEGQNLFGWTIYPLPMENLDGLKFQPISMELPKTPTFLRGYIEIGEQPCDTFLRTDGFSRGFVKINGFNVGRFDKRGPQKTLYIPAPLLRKGKNEILVFDADEVTAPIVEFSDKPDLG